MSEKNHRGLTLSLSEDAGPPAAASSAHSVGLFSSRCLRFSLPHGDEAEQRVAVREIDHVIAADDVLHYAVFPARLPEAPGTALPWQSAGYASTGIGIDLVLDDGTRLTTTVDQHGASGDARSQGESRTLTVDQWNVKTIALAEWAGSRVTAIELVVIGSRTQDIEGWLDGIEIRAVARQDRTKPSDWVDTRRGSHSTGTYSRGNTIPTVATPNGFSFVTPVSNAAEESWPYAWHAHNTADNRQSLEAFAVCHLPTPWLGDHHVLQFFPAAGAVPTIDRSERALAFGHANEVARAHRYDVEFDAGITAAVTSTEHVTVARFTWPHANPALILDQLTDEGGLVFSPGRDEAHTPVLTGFSDYRANVVSAGTRMFFALAADHRVVTSGRFAGAERPTVSGFIRFEAAENEPVTIRIATSFISVEQAIRSLGLETSATDSVDSVAAATQEKWDALLGTVTVEGATDDQLTTLYSNMYRVFLFPNAAHENTGTVENPEARYATPFRAPLAAHTDTETGSAIEAGTLYVNNGFWDTYRTAWPAYHLLTPGLAADLIDGLVRQYTDGGWMARWSAPGYVDSMVGTSSDVVVADAIVKGVPMRNPADAYDSSLRNATAASSQHAVGRNGLDRAQFLGYVPTSTPESVSWSLENAINDFGIARFSEWMLQNAAKDDPRRDEYAANSVYFSSRAAGFSLLFDPETRFFRGRDEAGDIVERPEGFDPAVWGFDYAETNGWGMAFSVPHDGNGLAALYGGKDALEARLDEFFATPELAGEATTGSYGQVIHEMREARDMRMGMWGFSNQPAHHIPFLYAFTDSPHKTQAITRDTLARLFLGSEIGQGYPGDEDNGEMSAWHLFSALGFFPLAVGSSQYLLTAPLYPRATVTIPGGGTITVTDANQSRDNLYIQSLTVNGEPWTAPSIEHALLVAGCELEFVLGPTPSDWGRGEVVPSLTAPGDRPRPLRDLPRSVESSHNPDDAAIVFDDSSATAVDIEPGWWAAINVVGTDTATLYTVTTGDDPATAPSAWTVDVSDDGLEWTTLDSQSDVAFRWPRQTRAFRLPGHNAVRHYRFMLAGDAAASVSQLEFLG